MTTEDNESPPNAEVPTKELVDVENLGNLESIMSPRFRTVAAMAGWDEEALLLATLIVEDTPDRESKEKKRAHLQFKSPQTSSRRKRRAQRRNPASIPIVVLNLDDEETTGEEDAAKKMESKVQVIEEKKREEDGVALPEKASDVSSSRSSLPCMDRLREELSCAICLEICFEPSTTPCGHSFCKKCLRSAADKCGKRCPKCRQLIGNGRSCTVNTVLWNTIQLLFPAEVEARKATGALNSREAARRSPGKGNTRNRIVPLSSRMSREISASRREEVSSPEEEADAALAFTARRRRGVTGQELDDVLDISVRGRRRVPGRVDDGSALAFTREGGPNHEEDAALAFRFQREEFMEAFRGTTYHHHMQPRSSLSSARANLRAMASRAMKLRIRGRST